MTVSQLVGMVIGYLVEKIPFLHDPIFVDTYFRNKWRYEVEINIKYSGMLPIRVENNQILVNRIKNCGN